jgi:hypothetical protein
MSTIKDKVVWITGASSGIGEALAYAIAEKGSTLILSARRKEELDRVKKNCIDKFGAKIFVLPIDLGMVSSLQQAVAEAVNFTGHVDILIKQRRAWAAKSYSRDKCGRRPAIDGSQLFWFHGTFKVPAAPFRFKTRRTFCDHK